MSIRIWAMRAPLFGVHMPMALFAPDGGDGGAPATLKEVVAQFTEVGAKLKTVTDEVKKNADKVHAEIKNLGDATRETKDAADKALTQASDAKAQLDAIEQKLARLAEAGGERPKLETVGQQVVRVGQDAIARLAKRQSARETIEIKNLVTSLTTDAAGSAGAAIDPQRQPGILIPALRRMTVRQLLAPGRTTSNSIEWVQEKGFTNNAGTQAAEGDEKPESNIQLELKNTPVVTVAHWIRASKQVLSDVAQLQSYIDQRLRYGLMFEEERQLLLGDGTGGDLSGLVANSTAFNPAFTPDSPTFIDQLRLAMLQAQLAEWPATGHILHPTDWARIELTKDSQNRYIWANPVGVNGPTMWGLPVVATQAMPEDTFMTGAFVPAAQIFDREDANVIISTEDRDNVIRNLVTILCEERLALAVYRPEAIIYGQFELS